MFFMGRRSKAAQLERDLSEAGSKAMETIGDLAEHAINAARGAGQVAAPAVQHSAEAAVKALERAAETLSERGEKFAQSDAGVAARHRLADASERFGQTIRPRKRHHRVRNLLIAGAVVGGIVALVQSPLKDKITERLFGPSPEDEPESIQLPGTDSYDTSSVTGAEETSSAASSETEETQTADGEDNGVPTAQGGRESQA